MKHFHIKNKFRFTTAMVILFVLGFFAINAIATKVFSHQEPRFREVVVTRGDTLWGLCQSMDGNIYENIYQIQRINNLDDCNIYVGQYLKIPIS